MGASRCWTVAELRSAKTLLDEGKPLPEIGLLLDRSPEGVRKALNLAGIILPRGPKPRQGLDKYEEAVGLMADDRKMRRDAVEGSRALLEAILRARLVAA
jgi:hypothetical protein